MQRAEPDAQRDRAPRRRLWIFAAPLALLAAISLGGCAYPSAAVLVVPADPTRSGERGELGPYGVAREGALATVRADESLRYEVFWPCTEQLLVDGGPHPSVVMLPASFTTPSQIHWLATWVASTGHVVLVPKAELDVMASAETSGDLALEVVRDRSLNESDRLFGALEPEAAGAVLGFGVAGALAVTRWIARPDRFSTVALLAARPDRGLRLDEQVGRRSLVMVGEDDGVIGVDTAEEGWARMPDPSTFAVVRGMTYMDWLDGTNENQQEMEGGSGRPLGETRADAEDVLGAWLSASLGDESGALEALDLDGVELQ